MEEKAVSFQKLEGKQDKVRYTCNSIGSVGLATYKALLQMMAGGLAKCYCGSRTCISNTLVYKYENR